MNAMSSSVTRRGWPPAQAGSRQAGPLIEGLPYVPDGVLVDGGQANNPGAGFPAAAAPLVLGQTAVLLAVLPPIPDSARRVSQAGGLFVVIVISCWAVDVPSGDWCGVRVRSFFGRCGILSCCRLAVAGSLVVRAWLVSIFYRFFVVAVGGRLRWPSEGGCARFAVSPVAVTLVAVVVGVRCSSAGSVRGAAGAALRAGGGEVGRGAPGFAGPVRVRVGKGQ